MWKQPLALRCYVCTVIAAWVAASGWAAARTAWSPRDVVLFTCLTGFGALVIEIARRAAAPEPAGLIKDLFAAWLLPCAILLPPMYGLAAPVLTFTLLQIRVRRTFPHRRVFSTASNGLALAAVSAGIHALPVTPARPWWWLLAAAGGAVTWLIVHTALAVTAGWLTDRTVSIRDELFTPASLSTDICDMAAGVLLAGAVAAFGPVLLIPALPLVVALQRLFRAAQADTRTDQQTGLLHGAAWRADVEVQLAQAARTGSPLTIGIIHVDLADSTRGYLARDAALAAAAEVVHTTLRSYDLSGRVGQQIVIALPGTATDEARRVAERLRDSLANLPLTTGPGQEPVQIVATLGLAVADAPAHTDLHSLLTVADVALYRAEQDGRPHVCLPASTTTPGNPEPDTHETPDPAGRRNKIDAARRALGKHLADAREHAGLTQEELEHISGYKRATIAGAERSGEGGADFWAAMDGALPGNAFAETHARIKAMADEARSQAAKWARRARAGAAGPEHNDTPASGAALADSACPHCGKPLAGVTVISTIIGTRPQHTHLPD